MIRSELWKGKIALFPAQTGSLFVYLKERSGVIVLKNICFQVD